MRIPILLWLAWCGIMTAFPVTAVRAGNDVPRISIVYPKPGQLVTAVDSTFIFGNVRPAENTKLDRLLINGYRVDVHRDGGFLAFLPIEPGEFTFVLEAFFQPDKNYFSRRSRRQESFIPQVVESLTVSVPEPLRTIPLDSLTIAAEYHPPLGNMDLAAGEVLTVSFRGTPRCQAWFAVPGVVDSVPMAETTPQMQAYWGESVFGAGAVPETLKVRGIYQGFWTVPENVCADSLTIHYFLAPLPKEELLRQFIQFPYDFTFDRHLINYLAMGDTVVEQPSSYRISLNSPDYPFTVRFVDSVQIVRFGPKKGYLSIFQPEGVQALAVGAVGEWYKLKLSQNHFGWVKKAGVERLPKGILPPTSYLSSIRMESDDDRVLVSFPLAGQHPFQVVEDGLRTVRIRLFGVTSNTDWIRYDGDDELVHLASWSQPEEGVFEFTLKLAKDIWGYDTYYQGNTFVFQLNKPPQRVKSLRGKVIVIDPGHSKDPGAIGPTGYTEAEANLALALEIKKKLQSKGATVVLTREDDSDVGLYERPAIAKRANADIFVSIHNNALPDGVNPFTNNGTSAYYYHPHSLRLARSIHTEMIKATGLPDHGLYYGNLAVNRPAQYPAVLVECAFMIIPQQEAMLKTKKFRRKVAKAVTKGIENFLKGYEHDN